MELGITKKSVVLHIRTTLFYLNRRSEISFILFSVTILGSNGGFYYALEKPYSSSSPCSPVSTGPIVICFVGITCILLAVT